MMIDLCSSSNISCMQIYDPILNSVQPQVGNVIHRYKFSPACVKLLRCNETQLASGTCPNTTTTTYSEEQCFGCHQPYEIFSFSLNLFIIIVLVIVL